MVIVILVILCPENERRIFGTATASIQPNSVSMAQSVLLVGHGCVPRLVRFMRETDRDKFEFKAARTECNYTGRGVLPLQNLLQMGRLQNWIKHRPHEVIFDVGTNELDKRCADAAELGL